MTKTGPRRIEGHPLALTHPDKVMYPATGTTKADVLAYYEAVAPVLLPCAVGRPVTRKRWVDGVAAPAFFQKDIEDSAPDWVPTRRLQHRDHANWYPILDAETGRATLAWFAQVAALELHVPQWRFRSDGTPGNPDRIVFDLDPGEGAGLPECVEVAKLVRAALDAAGLPSVPVTSGSKGIHVYAPLSSDRTSAQATDFARDLARSLEAERPELVVSTIRRANRAGRVLLDWSQNSAAKTTIAPYSLRGRERPTVAMPRTWREITSGRLRQIELHEVLGILRRRGDAATALHDTDAEGESRRLRAGTGGRRPPLRPVVLGAAAPAPVPMPADPPTSFEALIAGDGGTAPIPTPRLGADLRPMLARLGTPERPPAGDDLAVEIKWDGVRVLAHVEGGAVTLRSRNGIDVTTAYPELRALADRLDGREAVLDGELVALDDAGRPSFARLRRRQRLTREAGLRRAVAEVPVRYIAFDLLALDGQDLTAAPHRQRRWLLDAHVADAAPVHRSPLLPGDPAAALAHARRLGLEGIVVKDPGAAYAAGRRSRAWTKIKLRRTQEVVVAGWTPSPSRGIGELLLGVPGEDGLEYVGRIGAGLDDDAVAELARFTGRLARRRSPLANVPAADARDARWLDPRLVGEVEIAERRRDGRLRRASWRGLRPDKSPDDVELELEETERPG